jgi:predicted anti-sigma-YlaC factor YlaD
MQKIQLQMHVAMCSACRIYIKQTALINKLLNKTFNVESAIDTTELEEIIVAKIS